VGLCVGARDWHHFRSFDFGVSEKAPPQQLTGPAGEETKRGWCWATKTGLPICSIVLKHS